MAESKDKAEVQSGPSADEIADAIHAKMNEEPVTGRPTTEAIAAERARTEGVEHETYPDTHNSQGQIVTEDGSPPDAAQGYIPPPQTGAYVTFPDYIRDEAENDSSADHDGHWVQVVQVHTYNDGKVPQVSFRCECAREYVKDWTPDLASEVMHAVRP